MDPAKKLQVKAMEVTGKLNQLNISFLIVNNIPNINFLVNKCARFYRFIPSRSANDMELAKFLLTKKSDEVDNAAIMSPSKLRYQRNLAESLHGVDIEKARILSYRTKAPIPSEAHNNGLRVLYSNTKSPIPKASRHIPQAPDRILDAPEIVSTKY